MPAAASAARRLRPEVSKNSSTALSSNEGELARSITTCVPAMACLRPSPVMVLTPVLGEAATTSWPPCRRMGTVFDPIRPVPPMMTILIVNLLDCEEHRSTSTYQRPSGAARPGGRSLLPRCRLGILHWQPSEPCETVGVCAISALVGPAGDVRNLGRIANGLQRGRVESENGELDAIRVHIGEPPVTEINQQAAHFVPKRARPNRLPSEMQRLVDRPMFLQRDLAIHAPSLRLQYYVRKVSRLSWPKRATPGNPPLGWNGH